MAQYRVLIVEDNPDTRELLKEQLDDERFELLTAKDGQDAILRVGERAPEVVIMDVMMPHLDGFETSRYLKLRYPDHFTPVLMLTAKSDAASREEGARYGSEDYRCKPYTASQLLTSVEALLELGILENQLLDAARAEDDEDSEPVDLQPAKERIIEIRLEIAERLLADKSVGIARNHAQRVLELAEGHTGAQALLSKIDAGEDE